MHLKFKYLPGLLLLAVITIWFALITFPSKNLRVIACDVGQGDAILLVYGSFQILTDGGLPNGKASECLDRYIPFWDRVIEVVVNTHPQLDHYGGLIEILANYKVNYFVANSLDSVTQEYKVLKDTVGSRGVSIVTPVKGTVIKYGLISYDIFWPTDAFLTAQGYDGLGGRLGTFTSERDPNDFSVQAVVSFGNFNILLTGDIGDKMKEHVKPVFPLKSINYIKIPHHGSRNALTSFYLEEFSPSFAAISAGRNNRYNHPHPEIVKLLNDKNIRILRTDTDGDIVVESDGKSFWLNNR